MNSSDIKSKTVTLNLVVQKRYDAELDYDTFVEEVMKQKKGETDEVFDARCLVRWAKLLENTQGELDLPEVEDDGPSESLRADEILTWGDEAIQEVRDVSK